MSRGVMYHFQTWSLKPCICSPPHCPSVQDVSPKIEQIKRTTISSLATLRPYQKCIFLGPTPKSETAFNKLHKWSMCILELEKHWTRGCQRNLMKRSLWTPSPNDLWTELPSNLSYPPQAIPWEKNQLLSFFKPANYCWVSPALP